MSDTVSVANASSIFGPAIASFELSSIARGYFLLDKIVKKAHVKILEASSVSPGKFFILINGDEASVAESRIELLNLCESTLIDEVYIPHLHQEVLPGLYAQNRFQVSESIAIVEVATVSSGLLSCDRALKSADVHLIDFRNARGIGGKSFYFLTGSLDNIQAAVIEAAQAINSRGTLIRTEVIPNPHEDFLNYFNIENG
jgi:microcompartment protein CcmL/EutN